MKFKHLAYITTGYFFITEKVSATLPTVPGLERNNDAKVLAIIIIILAASVAINKILRLLKK
ncbi:MAG: hypothetical protein V4690_02415 [Patescibacteria group bacterium]